MPPTSIWDDPMREIYIREAIERGLADGKAGWTKDVKEVRAKQGLPLNFDIVSDFDIRISGLREVSLAHPR